MPAVLSDKTQNYERSIFIFVQQKYLLNLLLKVYQTSFPVYIPKVTEKHKYPMARVIMKKKSVSTKMILIQKFQFFSLRAKATSVVYTKE